ncbi:TetR family transcriptional regulator [Mycobacterium antarcticum]|uniref:TetR/AcrR family transcriptional regulator n=1 Tax=Mycolicibacterium sp. TUM20983 TaxID=3023369 RepID=UPI00238732E4|nr:TetR/AcrR family transcriptional regulator [Mycolicibacterium sp. TUM20983]GLP78183.1 TetR family transcriptional regulator [Mycolicibacterium sp. TUM20983]
MDRGSRSKDALLDAAERLIAERGFEVPLRDIAQAAGQRNNSAVNYHFHSRQDLLDAVVARRLLPMERERERMLGDLDGSAVLEAGEVLGARDVHALMRVLVLPLLRLESTHYARFLQVVGPRLRTEPHDSAETAWPRVLEALSHAVPVADRRARRRRVAAVATAMFALAAEHERSAQDGDPEEIVHMLAAMLTATAPRLV